MSTEASPFDFSTVDLAKVGFKTSIRDTAAALNRQPDAEQVATLDSVIQKSAIIGEGNKVEVNRPGFPGGSNS